MLLLPDPIHRAAVADVLWRASVRVAASGASADAAVALVEEHNPDVVVADADLPEGVDVALAAVASLVRSRPRLAVVVLAEEAVPSLVARAFAAGASALVLKRGVEALSVAISLPAVRRPAKRVGPCEDAEAPKLTRRELEILRLVSERRSNREVGRLLWVSDQTVKFHLANIYRKLGVGGRFEAAQAARERGLLTTPGELAPNGDLNAALAAIVSPPTGGTSR